MSEAKHTPGPTVTVDGRKVTVTFEMPFMAGDKCITPRHYAETTVSRGPEVAIRLWGNFEQISVQHEGAWYTANHTQMHGTNEFLPDKQALLEYWLARKERSTFEDRLSDLRHQFAKDTGALVRLQSRHVEMLQIELAATKAEVGQAVVDGTRRALNLEAAIAKTQGGSHG